MSAEIFQRQELKYSLTALEFENWCRIVKKKLIQDCYAGQQGFAKIKTIYYDTPTNQFARDNLSNEIFRQKIRLRAYSDSDLTNLAFIEIKRKCGSHTYKSRSAVKLDWAQRILKQNRSLRKNLTATERENYQINNYQLWQEIAYLHRLYTLQPKTLISYQRLAFSDQRYLRITFDKEIKYRHQNLSLINHQDLQDEYLLNPQLYIMEVKSYDNVPLWLCQELRNISPQNSQKAKYLTAYLKNIMI